MCVCEGEREGEEGVTNHEFDLSVIEGRPSLSSVSHHSELYPAILILYTQYITLQNNNLTLSYMYVESLATTHQAAASSNLPAETSQQEHLVQYIPHKTLIANNFTTSSSSYTTQNTHRKQLHTKL